jgi:hypothetical protein
VLRRQAFTALTLVALSGLTAPSALAMDVEITSDTDGQFYDVRSPGGSVVDERRRLTTTLAVAVYNLLDAPLIDPNAPQLSFRARLRYDADYGMQPDEVDPRYYATTYVPGGAYGNQIGISGAEAVDLMYAYVEGRKFLHGWLGFKLGRQYVTDSLGWWAFDGGEAAVTTPYFFKAEVYGGLEERGGLPLSTSRFESDGIWRGNRSNLDPLPACPGGPPGTCGLTGLSLYPAFQTADIAPAIGVALESTGFTWIHGRLTYRRVYDTGSSNVTEFPSSLYAPAVYSGGRISSERIGYAVDANLTKLGGAKAGIVYDLYRAEVTSLYASVDAYLGNKVTLSADYDYYVPSFDGDSIWNIFAGEPTNDVALRANVDVTDQLSFAGSGNARIFTIPTSAFDPIGNGGTNCSSPPCYSPYTNSPLSGGYFPSNGHPFDEGFNLSGRWKTGEMRVAVRAAGNFGDEGDRVGGDLSAERVIETRYIVSGRAGVWQWDDKLRPDRSTTDFTYVLGVGYRFLPRCQGGVEWEQDVNGLVGDRFRLLATLKLAVPK